MLLIFLVLYYVTVKLPLNIAIKLKDNPLLGSEPILH